MEEFTELCTTSNWFFHNSNRNVNRIAFSCRNGKLSCIFILHGETIIFRPKTLKSVHFYWLEKDRVDNIRSDDNLKVPTAYVVEVSAAQDNLVSQRISFLSSELREIRPFLQQIIQKQRIEHILFTEGHPNGVWFWVEGSQGRWPIFKIVKKIWIGTCPGTAVLIYYPTLNIAMTNLSLSEIRKLVL